MYMHKWMWWALGALVAIGIAAFSFAHRAGTPPSRSSAGSSVSLATVRYAPYDVVLEESGHVGAPSGTQSLLAFPSAGILRDVYVRVGERVAAGQALAALDTRPLSLAAQQATADAQAAHAQADAVAIDRYSTQLAVDRAGLARSTRLYQAGVRAAKDVQAARAQLAADEAAARAAIADRRAAQAQSSSADARAALASTELANATLRAPNGGVVTAILRRIGEGVDPTTPVLALAPSAQGEVTLQVPSSDATQIAVGDPVRIEAGGETANGSVSAVVPALDPATQAATVVVRGMPSDAVAGAAVRARITVAHVRGLLVPETAIVQDPQSGETVVFVGARRKDGSVKFEQRVVHVAHEDETTADLRDGVRAGERVAAQGAFELLAPVGGGG